MLILLYVSYLTIIYMYIPLTSKNYQIYYSLEIKIKTAYYIMMSAHWSTHKNSDI